jgi:hypothetical protein
LISERRRCDSFRTYDGGRSLTVKVLVCETRYAGSSPVARPNFPKEVLMSEPVVLNVVWFLAGVSAGLLTNSLALMHAEVRAVGRRTDEVIRKSRL